MNNNPENSYKALFLDRDGVINIDTGYVYQKQEFVFRDNIFEFVQYFALQNFKIFIVTNQSGIGRNYFDMLAFLKLSQYIMKKFSQHKILIEDILFCPDIPSENCNCRKPRIGMLEYIEYKNKIVMEESYMVGDKDSDTKFAHNAKIGHFIHATPNTNFLTILEKLQNEKNSYINF